MQDKISCQVRELNRNGIDAEAWLFSTLVKEDTKYNDHVIIRPLQPVPNKKKYFNGFYETQFYYSQISQALDNAEFDLLFLRHGTSGPEYFKLISKFAKKMFLYIPSDPVTENYREKQYAGKTGPIGYFFRWYEFFFYFLYWENKLYKKYLDKVKGVVLFTPEFASRIRKRSKGKAKVYYNRDGADCAGIKIRQPKTKEGPIKLIFLKGSSLLQPWAGIDRLIRSIKSYPQLKFELIITGNLTEPERYDEPFVKTTGRLPKDELEKLIDEVDLGVSNLANYLINFNETTNLKSRDYFARGLPFIQANTMPDVDGTPGEKYYLRLPNDGSVIDMKKVADFAEEMRANASHAKEMREFAEKNLDWAVTVKELSVVLKNGVGSKDTGSDKIGLAARA